MLHSQASFPHPQVWPNLKIEVLLAICCGWRPRKQKANNHSVGILLSACTCWINTARSIFSHRIGGKDCRECDNVYATTTQGMREKLRALRTYNAICLGGSSVSHVLPLWVRVEMEGMPLIQLWRLWSSLALALLCSSRQMRTGHRPVYSVPGHMGACWVFLSYLLLERKSQWHNPDSWHFKVCLFWIWLSFFEEMYTTVKSVWEENHGVSREQSNLLMKTKVTLWLQND